jgi:hypothetical protein
MNYHLPMLRRFLKTLYNVFILAAILITLLVACSTKKGSEEKVAGPLTSDVPYDVSEDKSALEKCYNLDHIKEWYTERISAPAFDYDIDLSKKSMSELELLRNEIYARNGYLFDDAVLRGYFNKFKWSQPIFEVEDFKVVLNKEEDEFVNKVIARENELMKERYIKQSDFTMINMSHVHNLMQFKQVDNNLMKMLAEKNFAIVPAQHEQLFHVYDNNHYQYIPNFITTDLYLQVLHKHFSSLLQKIEETKLVPLMTNLMKGAYEQTLNVEAKSGTDEELKNASKWSATYFAIAHSLITGKTMEEIPATIDEEYAAEMEKILSSSDVGSAFLKTDNFQYSQFKPRGNYTKTDTLENYFRCIKWLNTAPVYITEDQSLLSALIIASAIKQSPELLAAFEKFNEAIKFIVGDEDNLSIATLISIIPDADAGNVAAFNTTEKLKSIREQLAVLKVDKITPKAERAVAAKELAQQSILFTAGRYTFDAEILSRLIHVLQPEPKRPFPKGLDVFAALGNKEAENILQHDYNEPNKWKAYPDSLQKLQTQFVNYADWDKNIYTKTFSAINALHSSDEAYPLFMKTPSWSKKNLITSLAAWAQLKHDMLLYSEQPYAAEAGEGGGPPPPKHLSYVEPNVKFWEASLSLLELQENTLTKLNLGNDEITAITKELKEIGNHLLTVSRKELANEKVSDPEFESINWLGGQIEYLTFKICGTDHLPEKEKLVALVADVYNYNGQYLEEAVGMVDEIYVVTEINGKPYLTKGAVFSYYEFTSGSPMTDEEWSNKISKPNTLQRPLWVKDITIKTTSLESKPEYSF